MEAMEQNFDSLFSADTKDLGDLQRQVVTRCVPPSGPASGAGSRQGSRGGSGPGSRGSPARKPTMSTLCPSNPAVTELQAGGSAASRSHSMRDQTSHMKEKYQSRYSQRRLSTKNSSPAPGGGSRTGSRNNSLPGDEVEVTRQFLATNKKVINRGDSFKRRERPAPPQRSNIEISVACPEERVPRHADKVYRVVFLGSGEVGKTSIIDQFMSSEHADVYIETADCPGAEDREMRTVTVDVNGEESRLSLVEVEEEGALDSTEELNPDCYVVVYAVDDEQSFEYAKKCLRWLTSNHSLAGKSSILVGNKADLERSRLLQTGEGVDLAIEFGVKFTETSPGMGHHIDELLVGIVMQMRLRESPEYRRASQPATLKETVKGFFSLLSGGKGDERRKSCRNLNI